MGTGLGCGLAAMPTYTLSLYPFILNCLHIRHNMAKVKMIEIMSSK